MTTETKPTILGKRLGEKSEAADTAAVEEAKAKLAWSRRQAAGDGEPVGEVTKG